MDTVQQTKLHRICIALLVVSTGAMIGSAITQVVTDAPLWPTIMFICTTIVLRVIVKATERVS